MDLLVAPLYGEKPEIGVRELIQNAVDACLERDDLIAKGFAAVSPATNEDVVVSLIKNDAGDATIIIEDYGVGMTAEIVDRYFLNVGASFRSSDLWRKNHETGGHSTIHRTGRFGIGLLAAFLLGPEIKVTTRHIGAAENNAISFTCTQGDESIEVSHCKFHSGTRIEIPLSKKTAAALLKDTDEWDWYCLSKPNVRRTAPSAAGGDLPQAHVVPACDAYLDGTAWRRISAEGFDDVLWSYEALEKWGRPHSLIICNGILICQNRNDAAPSVSPRLGIIRADAPSLVIYDPDGRFPINLQRSAIEAKHISFSRELSLDASNYLAKRLLDTFDTLTPAIAPANIALSLDPKIPGLGERQYPGSKPAFMILSKDGVLPADADLMQEAGITSLLIDATNLSANRGAFRSRTVTEWVSSYCAVASITGTKSSRSHFLRLSIGESTYYGEAGYFIGLNIIGRRILVRKSDVTELVRPANVPRKLWSRLSMEKDLKDWGLYSMGNVPPLTLDLSTSVAELDEHEAFGFSILYFAPIEKTANGESDAPPSPSPFSVAWRQLVGSPVLRQRHG